jgi:hypothetical protein
MEDAPADPERIAALTRRVRSLVLMLHDSLDTADAHIDALACCALPSRALMISEKLQRAWSDAFLVILVLEGISRRSANDAWRTLACSYAKACESLARTPCEAPRPPWAWLE